MSFLQNSENVIKVMFWGGFFYLYIYLYIYGLFIYLWFLGLCCKVEDLQSSFACNLMITLVPRRPVFFFFHLLSCDLCFWEMAMIKMIIMCAIFFIFVFFFYALNYFFHCHILLHQVKCCLILLQHKYYMDAFTTKQRRLWNDDVLGIRGKKMLK